MLVWSVTFLYQHGVQVVNKKNKSMILFCEPWTFFLFAVVSKEVSGIVFFILVLYQCSGIVTTLVHCIFHCLVPPPKTSSTMRNYALPGCTSLQNSTALNTAHITAMCEHSSLKASETRDFYGHLRMRTQMENSFYSVSIRSIPRHPSCPLKCLSVYLLVRTGDRRTALKNASEYVFSELWNLMTQWRTTFAIAWSPSVMVQIGNWLRGERLTLHNHAPLDGELQHNDVTVYEHCPVGKMLLATKDYSVGFKIRHAAIAAIN